MDFNNRKGRIPPTPPKTPPVEALVSEIYHISLKPHSSSAMLHMDATVDTARTHFVRFVTML